MKLLVCGSRSIADKDLVWESIEASRWEPDTIIHGDAEGVDKLADRWARQYGVDIERHPIPDWVWEKYGSSSGPVRNGYMVGEADAVVAIWDGESSGTKNTIRQAIDGGVPVYKVVCQETDAGWQPWLKTYEDGAQSSLNEFE